MHQCETPQWQPITQLPLIASHIDGMLEIAEGQYHNLQEAQPKPWMLDNDTINRVINAFTTQRDDLWLFDEQLRRWHAEQLTAKQRVEVERLVEQMIKLRETITMILILAHELAAGTIEKQL